MQPRQRQPNANNNISMTSCHKGGIKIRDTGNNKIIDPFAGVNPFNVHTEEKSVAISYDRTSYEKLDLNIDSYSREELFKLYLNEKGDLIVDETSVLDSENIDEMERLLNVQKSALVEEKEEQKIRKKIITGR